MASWPATNSSVRLPVSISPGSSSAPRKQHEPAELLAWHHLAV